MSNQHIDRIFREKLNDGSMPVPSELWGNIEPFIAIPQRRNRWGLLWMFGAGALIMTAAMLYFATPASSNATEQPNDGAASMAQLQMLSDQSSQSSSDDPVRMDETSEVSGTDARAVSSESKSVNTRVSKSTQRSSLPIALTPIVETEVTKTEIDVSNVQSATAQKEVEHTQESRPTRRTPFLALAMAADRALPDPTVNCYSFGRKRGGSGGVFFAEIYTGPTFSNKKFDSRAEDVSSYITQRDTTESSRLSWHAGLRVGYWHHSGITARLGAHYTIVNELFDYFNGSYVGTVTVIDTIFDGSGNIIDYDTLQVPRSGQRFVTTHNHYQTLDVPLLIGYMVSQDRWTYGIQAGPVFNVMFAKKGRMISPDGSIVTFTDDDAMEYPAFRDHLGLSIYASGQIAYRIGERMWVYGEPYFQKRLDSITLDSYPIDQRQTNVGLSLGLRVTL